MKYKLATADYGDEVILFKNVNNQDYEIKSFKSSSACTKYINKNFVRLDKYSIDKDYGTYIKQ